MTASSGSPAIDPPRATPTRACGEGLFEFYRATSVVAPDLFQDVHALGLGDLQALDAGRRLRPGSKAFQLDDLLAGEEPCVHIHPHVGHVAGFGVLHRLLARPGEGAAIFETHRLFRHVSPRGFASALAYGWHATAMDAMRLPRAETWSQHVKSFA